MSILGTIGEGAGALIAANGGPAALVVVVAASIGRAIPDNKKGFLGFLRKLTKFIGLYQPTDLNRTKAQVVDNTQSLGNTNTLTEVK